MGLQHLTSLQDLSISKCPKMVHLPEMLLPTLLTLAIKVYSEGMVTRNPIITFYSAMQHSSILHICYLVMSH
ncbi:hypothetical protein L1887_32658 [Cichorium endivia]|nr:hypothetical protein L1887_32658 [Cichorium endivia]